MLASIYARVAIEGIRNPIYIPQAGKKTHFDKKNIVLHASKEFLYIQFPHSKGTRQRITSGSLFSSTKKLLILELLSLL